MPFATAITDAAETVAVVEPPTGENPSGGITDSFTRPDSSGDAVGSGEWATAAGAGDWDVFHNVGRSPPDSPDSIVGIVDGAMSVRVPRPTVFDVDGDNTQVELPGSNVFGLSFGLTYRLKFESQDLNITDITPFVSFVYGQATWGLETGATNGTTHGKRLFIFAAGAGAAGTGEIFGYVLTTGQWYWVRWENEWRFHHRLKIWPQGQAEPVSWTLERTAFNQSAASAQPFSMFVEQGGSSLLPPDLGQDFWVKMDDLYIYRPGPLVAP